jgi:kynurenine formamidase
MRKSGIALALAGLLASTGAQAQEGGGLWRLYDDGLRGAAYIDLTHTITPRIPVWSGFSGPSFGRAKAGVDIPNFAAKGDEFSFEKHGFEATEYRLPTDQLGTQLDPPAHWAPEYPAIDELPATYAVRPLAVIPIVEQLRRDDNYALQVADIETWEKTHGRIPAGAVVMVRSDWSKRWPDPALATLPRFPGVSLAALRFLHEERRILFHGHEPLDTD